MPLEGASDGMLGAPNDEYFQPAGPRCMFYLFILLSVLFGHFIHRHHWKYVTEGSVALLLGLYVGGLFYVQYELLPKESRLDPRLLQIDDDMFFSVLLPPIIFYAGFSVKKQLFFHQFFTLVTFGVFGTMTMAALIATGAYWLLPHINSSLWRHHLLSTSLSLGAIFASTDTVAALQTVSKDKYPVLHSLVFGEGVVNDATAIVLLTATHQLAADVESTLGVAEVLGILFTFSRLFVISLLLGVAVGLVSAAIIRHLFNHHSTEREVLVVALLGNISYAAAEALDLSPILSVFFTGVTMSHYTWHSLSEEAQVITRHGFGVIASLAELVLFVYAGADMWVSVLWQDPLYSSLKVVASIAAVALGLLTLMAASRACFAFPLVHLANATWRKSEPLTHAEAAVLWLSGLPRGSITLALAYRSFYDANSTDAGSRIIIAASVIIVLFTTVGFGAGLGPAIDWLLRQPSRSRAPSILPDTLDSEQADGDQATAALLSQDHGTGFGGSGDSALSGALCFTKRSQFHTLWRRFDARFMQPHFGGSKARPEPSSPPAEMIGAA